MKGLRNTMPIAVRGDSLKHSADASGGFVVYSLFGSEEENND